MEFDMKEVSSWLSTTITEYGLKIIVAILIWIIGSIVVSWLTKMIVARIQKNMSDDSIKPFLSGLIKALLKTALIIAVLGSMGVEMASFVAIIGAMGLAVGLALSGTLQNFAGGVMILLFKPFKVGDYIDAIGYQGSVSEIQIFNTIMKTPDNKVIILPNGPLSTSPLTNYSTEPQRRVDINIGVAYGTNLSQAKKLLRKLANADERILKDPEVVIVVTALGDSAVNIAMRAWVEAADYWPVFLEMNEKVYDTYNEAGIGIPFPQMDVHLYKEKKA